MPAEPRRPRVVVLGADGQVGWELLRTLAPLGPVVGLTRRQADLERLTELRAVLRGAEPDVIVNAAAWTGVDAAEAEEARAQVVNGDAPGVIAEVARERGALLVHYSTDYVFDGTGTRPYREDDPTGPIGAYGRTKLAGERAVLATGAWAYVLRTSWVYGRRGKNFLRTVQRLAAGPGPLRIVHDQLGAPTWSRALAECTALAVARAWGDRAAGREVPPAGVYNATAPDHTSWHGFAEAIVALSPARPDGTRATVEPIPTSAFPTPARRPAWSVLDPGRLLATFGLALPPWREQLAQCLDDS